MEYLVLIAALAAFMVFLFVSEALRARKRRKLFVQSLYDSYGELPRKKMASERFARVGGYYRRHGGDGQVDDITWNDLNMDDVFRRMDYTFSATGEEYLYYTLRNTAREISALERQESAVEWFETHADERVSVQLLMDELGYTGKFSLYDYIDNLEYLGERSNRRHYLALGGFLLLLLVAPFRLSVALFGLAALSVFQITVYFKEKGVIEPYITSFAYVTRLMRVCAKLCKLPLPVCAEEQERMRQHLRELGSVRKGSYWVFSSGQSRMTGSPLDIIMDYARMVFHVDLIVFNRMLAGLRGHLADIDGLVTLAGAMETAISIGAYRATLKNGWCVPKLWEADFGCSLRMAEGYHPLLENPVKNSITADRGVLLTGSNASGKSTFLKMVALNAIMAQTIHTCAASDYRAAVFRICSSMALRDDLAGGESYYIVEIKALKRILDAGADCGMSVADGLAAGAEADCGMSVADGSAAGSARKEAAAARPVLCFVDEVLRGTNTVERIAASTQIMRSLAAPGILCFAATHDIELTELLRDQYDNYHFEEDVQNGDITFHYKLLQGKAATRNAIRLLEVMGYEPAITDSAERMAERFVESGVWQG